jgi:hypothetical protein
MSDIDEECKKLKRKPGRPRTKPIKSPPIRRGILNAPETETNIIEMRYCSTMILKKLGALAKNLKSDFLRFIFNKDEVFILMNSYIEHVKVKIRIDGTKLHSYYCETPQTIYISYQNWETVIQKIDKDCDEFIICVDKNNMNKEIDIILINSYGIYNYLEVDVIDIPPSDMKVKLEDFNILSDKNYDLIFTLPSASLKKIFGTEKNIDNKWKLQKDGKDGDIEFGYDSKNKQVRGRQVPAKNKKVIKYIKNIEDDRTFLVNFRLDDIKPITDTQLTHTMIIKASDNNQPIWMTALLDADESTRKGDDSEDDDFDTDDYCITVDITVGVVDYKGDIRGLNGQVCASEPSLN